MLKPLIIAALAITAASPAVAQTSTSPSTSKSPSASKAKDPNRKICEKVEKIGSRLNVVRVCMTAAQWEAQKRDHREHFETVQRNVNQAPAN